MTRTSLLSILMLTATLAGCAEKTAAPATTAAGSAGESTTAAGPADPTDRAAARERARPPRPRHLGSGATADGARRAFPDREEMRARREERRQEMLGTFDADQDGSLSAEERTAMQQARVAEMVARIDVDHDGKLSKTEVDAMPARGRRGPPDFATLDADRDGFVTVDEMAAARPQRRFGRGERGDRNPEGDADTAPAK